jgi:hypothetical protein
MKINQGHVHYYSTIIQFEIRRCGACEIVRANPEVGRCHAQPNINIFDPFRISTANSNITMKAFPCGIAA